MQISDNLPLVVRGPEARGPGHSVVDAWQDEFISGLVILPEHSYPVHARWGALLVNVPEMVGRKLYEDLSDVYALAYSSTGTRLIVLADLLSLQARFIEFLRNHQRILPHSYVYHMCILQVWQARLETQLEKSRPWRRRHGKVKRPVVPGHQRLPWEN